MPGRRGLAAILTVAIILVIVILPVLLIAASLVQESADIYSKLKAGDLDPLMYFQPIFRSLPSWMIDFLDSFGLTDIATVKARLGTALVDGVQVIASQALAIGQNTFAFVVGLGVTIYLLFFLLRDGESLFRRIELTIPLNADLQKSLFTKFALVIRATVRGDFLVAILQGALGGLIFWLLGIHAVLLWATLMAFLSLLPAIGAALVWLPVAFYFLSTGAMWEGIVLIAYGLFVIGLVDNFLRPILVGQSTKMPDYVVLISTLGGIETFGIQGFIMGPVIAAMFLAVWDVFSATRQKTLLPT